jgi:hypothetical protein
MALLDQQQAGLAERSEVAGHRAAGDATADRGAIAPATGDQASAQRRARAMK